MSSQHYSTIGRLSHAVYGSQVPRDADNKVQPVKLIAAFETEALAKQFRDSLKQCGTHDCLAVGSLESLHNETGDKLVIADAAISLNKALADHEAFVEVSEYA